MTAVEWLILNLTDDKDLPDTYEVFQQALIMERQNHHATWYTAIHAHDKRGHSKTESLEDFEEYFKTLQQDL